MTSKLMPQGTNLLVTTHAFTLSAHSAQGVSICEIVTNTKVGITSFSKSFAFNFSTFMIDVMTLTHYPDQ